MVNLRQKIATVVYAINTLALYCFGLIYMTRSRWIHYHEEVTKTPWNEVTQGMQLLYLYCLKLVGGGAIVLGIATSLLLCIPFKRGERWSRYAIPILQLVYLAFCVYCTLAIHIATNASTPWKLCCGFMAATLLAMLLSLSDRTSAAVSPE